jgi:hypothetical protein
MQTERLQQLLQAIIRQKHVHAGNANGDVQKNLHIYVRKVMYDCFYSFFLPFGRALMRSLCQVGCVEEASAEPGSVLQIQAKRLVPNCASAAEHLTAFFDSSHYSVCVPLTN